MYGAVMKTLDMIKRSGILLDALIVQNANISAWRNFYENFLKPYVIFPLIFVIVIPAMTVLYMLKSTYRIIFTAMVLWRAYESYVQIDFKAFLNPFLRELSYFTWGEEIVRYLYIPIVFLMDKLSNLSINLDALQVTCSGSQTPIYLLIDMIIVVAVVVVIESDVVVFWIMMIGPTMGKIRSIVFNRHYFGRNILSSSFFLSAALLIAQLPDPSKFVQYCMGFIVIKRFFNLSGNHPHSDWVAVSQNCDASISVPVTIPMDSMLAYFSAISAIFVLPVGEISKFIVLF